VSLHRNIENHCEEEEEGEEEPLAPVSSHITCNKDRPRSGWSEHTWSVFTARAEEEVEEMTKGKILLSKFQEDKFTNFFYHVR
jgi:hypothetical protein